MTPEDDLFGPPLEDEPGDLFGQVEDPARRFGSPSARREAFQAWVAAGRPWPPPAGLTSAIAGALVGGRR